MAKAVNKAKQRYEAKLQRKKIVSQLEQMQAAGYTPDQIRALGKKDKDQTQAASTPQPTAGATTPAWWQQMAQGYAQQGTAYSASQRPAEVRQRGWEAPVGAVNNAYVNPGILSYYQQAGWVAPTTQSQQHKPAENPELKYNQRGYQAPGNTSPPPAWWQQQAQGYANQASAYQASGGGQPPEGNLSDFYFRHPNTPTTATPTAATGGGYGYGNYRRRGGGGGGRGGYSYAPRQAYTKSSPAWARGGLANWSIG